MSKNGQLYRFVGLVFLWLIPCFTLWMTFGPLLAAPAVWLSEFILTAWMPNMIDAVTLQGTDAMLVTQFGELDGKIVVAPVAGYQMGLPLNTRLLSYSLPFFAALHFATPQQHSLRNFSIGFGILFGLLVFCLVWVSVKNLMLAIPGVFFSQTEALLPGGGVIAILYQLCTLIIPPLAPILVWGWQARNNTQVVEIFTRSSLAQPDQTS